MYFYLDIPLIWAYQHLSVLMYDLNMIILYILCSIQHHIVSIFPLDGHIITCQFLYDLNMIILYIIFPFCTKVLDTVLK